MKTRFTPLFALIALLLAASSTGRSQVISTLSGGSLVGYGALSAGSGWGQTFRTPDDVAVALDQFAVRLDYPGGVSFEAFIFEWTPSEGAFSVPTAPEAFKWSTGSEPLLAGSDTLLVFDIGHLALDPATTYAFYIATTGGYDSVPVDNAGGYTSGGAFVWNRPEAFSMPVGGDSYTSIYDLRFEATFSPLSDSISPVPEPATYATIGLAVCGVIALVQRRRREKLAATAVAA